MVSDYTFVNDESDISIFIQSIDRVNSIIYTIYIFALIYYNFPIKSLCCLFLTIYFIEFSRQSLNHKEWVFRHIVWHIISNIILLITLSSANSII